MQKSDKGEGGCFGLNYHHGTFDSWWITFSDSNMSLINDWIIKWDLTKPTLEMQTKEVQRSINKILIGNTKVVID